ncbi:hypothetical protein BDR07DRAFT_1407752 [Suillus spraguei]|nr:hypothetical protein BDR07DRAFT_1407752 [Suillus spraguei]
MLLIYKKRPLPAWCDAFDSELNTPKLWLPDTLEDILSEIKSWIRGAGENVPHVQWLPVTAGQGKSAITHTVAEWFAGVKALEACLCFERIQEGGAVSKFTVPLILMDIDALKVSGVANPWRLVSRLLAGRLSSWTIGSLAILYIF